MQQLQEAQLEHMNKMVEAFTAASIPASQEARNLHERRFREPRGLGEVGRDRARGDHGRRGSGRCTARTAKSGPRSRSPWNFQPMWSLVTTVVKSIENTALRFVGVCLLAWRARSKFLVTDCDEYSLKECSCRYEYCTLASRRKSGRLFCRHVLVGVVSENFSSNTDAPLQNERVNTVRE